jgi:hypothetical protein
LGQGGDIMQHNQVLEVEIEHEGSAHRASYFVENQTIYASIDGRMLLSPLGNHAPAETVRGLLSGYLQSRSRRLAAARRWPGKTVGEL